MFFDRHPGLVARQQHMNLRHQAIIAQNQHVFERAQVLDIGCSGGAWALAALDAGAVHVIGIEGRPDKVENANRHFRHYGVDPSRYQFIAGDVFDVLERQAPQVDVVLCLGFLYHTLRYPELLHHIRSTNARYLIVDTEVANTPAPVVRLVAENVDSAGNATRDQFSTDRSVLSGRPSFTAMKKMLRVYGYEVEKRSDWAAILRDNAETGIEFPVYAQGRRVTVLCRRGEALGWQDRVVSRF